MFSQEFKDYLIKEYLRSKTGVMLGGFVSDISTLMELEKEYKKYSRIVIAVMYLCIALFGIIFGTIIGMVCGKFNVPHIWGVPIFIVGAILNEYIRFCNEVSYDSVLIIFRKRAKEIVRIGK